jgi:hypothetical protein
MKISIIRSSWWEGYGYRLDCQPYLAGTLRTKIILERLSAPELQSLTAGHNGGIYHAGREPRTWVESAEFGVPFISSSHLLASDFSRLPLMARRQVADNPLLQIHTGWTLITRSGTIGRIAFARSAMDNLACSEHVMRVLPDIAKIQPGYLYAYLSSKFGIPLVVSGTYGAIIQHIEPEHLATLPVPRLGTAIESSAARMVDEASQLLTAYQTQIVAATEKFFSTVALRDINAAEWHQLGRDLGFEQTFPFEPSFRPLNFSPRFKIVCDRIMSKSWKALGDLCMPGTLKRAGRYQRVDADREFGYQLIGQRELFHLRPEGRWIARKSVGEDVFLSEGTIAVAARGTLGESELYCRCEFVWGPWTKFAYSEDILRVVADKAKILPGCLFAFLRSETAFRMLRSISSGGKMQENQYYLLPRLPIPLPKKSDQRTIHDMVVEAYEMRHRAVALEDEAIREVERAIERAVS